MDKKKVAICKVQSKTYFIDMTEKTFFLAYEKSELNSSKLLILILVANPVLALLNKFYFPYSSLATNIILFLFLTLIVWRVSKNLYSVIEESYSYRPVLLNFSEKEKIFEDGGKKIKIETLVYFVSSILAIIFLTLFFWNSNIIFLVLGVDCLFILFLGMSSNFFVRYKILKKGVEDLK